jgi:hypothetical protein
MGLRRSHVLLLALTACLVHAAPVLAGPVKKVQRVSRTSLKPGVVLVHERLSVRGYSQRQDLWRVIWKVGNPHLRLHAELRGNYRASDHSIQVSGIADWARRDATPGLVAAMTGDFSTPTSWWGDRFNVSGLLVSDRHVYSYGWGGPGVGYLPSGDFVMGTPRAIPTLLALPGGRTATIGLWDARASALAGLHADQVAVDTLGGSTVTVPDGYVAVSTASPALRSALRGSAARTNVHGLGKRETVTGFSIADPKAPLAHPAMALAAPAACGGGALCAGPTSIRVPRGGAVVIAREAPALAGKGLAAVAARPTPALTAAVTGPTWAAADDISGGKPQLVRRGSPVSTRPDYVDPWQWRCAGGCWRTAIARSASGSAWMAVTGAPGGYGMTMPSFAAVLSQLGARDAMGFDANGSAELYRPGARPITGFGWERPLPSLTALAYRG